MYVSVMCAHIYIYVYTCIYDICIYIYVCVCVFVFFVQVLRFQLAHLEIQLRP